MSITIENRADDLYANEVQITDLANGKLAGVKEIEDRLDVIESTTSENLTVVSRGASEIEKFAKRIEELEKVVGQLGYRSYKERPK